METSRDPFDVFAVAETTNEFAILREKPVVSAGGLAGPTQGAVTALFHGFDLTGQPMVAGLPELPGEVIPARTTTSLLRTQVGASVLLLFERGDVRRPIVVGVLEER